MRGGGRGQQHSRRARQLIARAGDPVQLKLRRATLSDVEILERWDEDEDVQASGGEDDQLDWEFEIPREVAWREILIAEGDEGALGAVVLIDAANEETHYWGDDVEPGAWAIDIWIGESKNRARGYGTQMMKAALARCFDVHGAAAVLVDPLAWNLRAIDFYRRVGFSVVGPRTFGGDECVVMRATSSG